ncbi:tRNA isopentenyltransferase [Choiromyces venosus 120613-1]|uniref:tRNA dimethylallyltransferase n=1 Tax=Choiromyces venosus 120613-1 TaxID=1336337 RepID=A0A3N4JSA4_9PEZI|nr:tRNA isopentenyltransferase [Choiromyces venosus 120613-1]
MAVPLPPLISVIGATGTGKSQLAVDLAHALNGEVINSDAMQMYAGLPIITNKPTAAEMRGIPHHLLSFLRIDEVYRVGQFVKEAEKKIEEIRSRGKLPIVVGGTHYYVQSLMFPHLVGIENEEENPFPPEPGGDLAAKYPILNSPTPELFADLQRVDPAIAEKWHPNDRRKIRRSLQIYYSTGGKQTASEVYAAQRAEKEQMSRHRNLVFWVHAETEALKERLDARVDKMIDGGMWAEIEEMKKTYDSTEVDMTKGIWQSIGFKELLPYLQLRDSQQRDPESESEEDKEKLQAELAQSRICCIETMKTATRQYARTQNRWIRIKILNALRPPSHIYLLNSTNPSTFIKTVTNPALTLAKQFLASENPSMPDPRSLSTLAEENLKPKREDFSSRPDLWVKKTCEVCGVTCINEEMWGRHIKSSRHKRLVKKAAMKEEVEGYILAKKEQRDMKRAELVKVSERRVEDLSGLEIFDEGGAEGRRIEEGTKDG